MSRRGTTRTHAESSALALAIRILAGRYPAWTQQQIGQCFGIDRTCVSYHLGARSKAAQRAKMTTAPLNFNAGALSPQP